MSQSTLAAARAKARRRSRSHLKRSPVSDITPEQELAMRRRARKCLLCGVSLTSKSGLSNSKHLDHIIPVNIGGTHTHGNVRIICRTCNLKRPKDGSDYTGPVTLWAQGETPVKRPRKKFGFNVATCRKGLHPWIAANIKVTPNGKKRCRACDKTHSRTRNPLRPCAKCGNPAPLPGSQAMCPPCIEVTAREAADLHAQGGLTWSQVAALVGYGSGTGAWYAAKRIGYVPAPPQPKPDRHPLCGCGRPVPDMRGKRRPVCPECHAATAQRAAEMYQAGMRLRDIANRLGYDSITSVSNLIKSIGETDMRIGRPSKLHA